MVALLKQATAPTAITATATAAGAAAGAAASPAFGESSNAIDASILAQVDRYGNSALHLAILYAKVGLL